MLGGIDVYLRRSRLLVAPLLHSKVAALSLPPRPLRLRHCSCVQPSSTEAGIVNGASALNSQAHVSSSPSTADIAAAAAAGAAEPASHRRVLGAAGRVQWHGTTSALASLADAFAAAVPEDAVSPAALQGHLMKHKRDPAAAGSRVGQLVQGASG